MIVLIPYLRWGHVGDMTLVTQYPTLDGGMLET